MKKLFTLILLLLFIPGLKAQQVFNRIYDVDSILNSSNTVIQTLDGGYIFGGSSWNLSTNASIALIIKSDSAGNVEWIKQYQWQNIGANLIENIIQQLDSSFIVTGVYADTVNMNGEVFLMKLDPGGDSIWFKTYYGAEQDVAYMVKPAYGSGFVIAGYTQTNASSNYEDALLIKTDEEGNLQWRHNYGGTGGEIAYSIDYTSDYGYVLGGWNGHDMYLCKVDSAGNLIWSNTYDIIGPDYGGGAIHTLDGGFLLIGSNGNDQGSILKVDSTGTWKWVRYLSYTALSSTIVAARQLPDSSYILAGSYHYNNSSLESEGWLLHVTSIGNTIWEKTYGQGNSLDDYFYAVDLTRDGGIIAAGQFNRYGKPYQDTWLVKTDSNGCDVINCNYVSVSELSFDDLAFDIYPNPADAQLTINYELEKEPVNREIAIYDMLARKQLSVKVQEKAGKLGIDTSMLPSGVYTVAVSSGGYIEQWRTLVIAR